MLNFLDHPGEMAERIRAFDWSGHPLGPPSQWPQPLKFALDMALASSFPTAIYWGPELRLLYNDSWSAILVERHPWALGRPGAEVWADIWDVVGPQMDRVVATGEGFANFDQMLPMERNGRPQETWWNYSFTPIRDEAGRVRGILNQGNETTRTVLAERARLAEVVRLRDVFDQAPGPIALLHGPDHVFEIANSAYLEMIGGRPVIGKPVAEALPEVVDQGFVDLLDQVYRTGESFRASGTHVQLGRVEGAAPETRILDFVYQPILDANDNTTDIFVAVTDVTDRTRAIEAARTAADELRRANETQALVHGLADALRTLDSPDAAMRLAVARLGERLQINRAGFYRISADGILEFGPCWTNGALPELTDSMPVAGLGGAAEAYRQGRTMVIRDSVSDAAGTALARLTPSAIGVPLLRGGQWVATLYANAAGPRDWSAADIAFVEAVAEIAWDAVERAAAAAALRESEEKFRAITNSIDQMVWATRPDGFHDYYNDRWYEYTGVPRGSTDGASWEAIFHPDDRERAWALWRQSLETGEDYRIEYRLRHRTGGYRWVLGSAKPVRDGEGRITRWFGTCTDIQDIVDAREVLTRSREELEAAIRERTTQLMAAEEQLRQAQKMEAVGQLTGGIAHDFNNMLAVVIGALDLLERRAAQGSTDLDRYLTAARDGATRAAALTQRLLAFSRQQPLAPVPLDTRELVDGMTELLVRTLGEDVTVETLLPRGVRPALADPNQLENMILNLAVNARDAMPGGGLLAIRTANAPLAEAEAARLELPAGDYVEIAVADTGSGMPPDVAARAFDPFFTTKGVGKGTGLGLSQVFGFVRQSGGAVRIESAPGAGTTVRIYLPAHRGEAPAPRAPANAAELPRARPGETVMVVEDEERVRGYSSEALRELGYSVIDARDGREALAILARGQAVTLLFTDIVMPEMSGRELAERARARLPGLKVLLTSGYAPDTVLPAAEETILAKPFDLAQLARQVRAVLDGCG